MLFNKYIFFFFPHMCMWEVTISFIFLFIFYFAYMQLNLLRALASIVLNANFLAFSTPNI